MKKLYFILALSAIFMQLQLTSFAQNWQWAKSAGGPQKVESYAVATDKHGNSYITGWFEDSLKFGSTTLVTSISGNMFASDVFIAKYDILGNLVWAKKAGGTNYDYGNGIVTDTAGNVYVTGLFIGTATFGTLTITSISNDYDVFVAKYDANGTALWVNKVGGTGWDVGNGITLDKQGNCLITGAYRSTGTFGTTSLTSAGNYDVFVAKYDGNGTFMWAQSAGGTGDDRAQGIVTDATGNSFVTGFFNGAGSFGTTNINSAGGSDIFLAKFDGSGNPMWAKKSGGIHDDVGNSIVVNKHGDLYVTGYYTDTATFDTAIVHGYGNKDAFVAKYDYKGDIIWVKKYGGTQDDEGYGISIDTFNNIYATGSFWGTGQFDTITTVSTNQDDAFVTGIDHTTDKTKWVMEGGGLNIDVSRGIAASAYGSCYITGYFSNQASFGSNSLTGFSVSDNDLFIARLDSTFIYDSVPLTLGITSNKYVSEKLLSYPNPFNSSITLAIQTTKEIKKIELYDLYGKLVLTTVAIAEAKNTVDKKEFTIDGSNLPEGVFFVKVLTNDGVFTTRIVHIKQ